MDGGETMEFAGERRKAEAEGDRWLREIVQGVCVCSRCVDGATLGYVGEFSLACLRELALQALLGVTGTRESGKWSPVGLSRSAQRCGTVHCSKRGTLVFGGIYETEVGLGWQGGGMEAHDLTF